MQDLTKTSERVRQNIIFDEMRRCSIKRRPAQQGLFRLGVFGFFKIHSSLYINNTQGEFLRGS